MTHIIKEVTKPIVKLISHIPGASFLAPIALTALGQPELAAAFSGINTLDNGGSLGKSLLSAGLSYGGSALGGSDTAFGDSLSGPISGALKGVGDSISGALGDVGEATGLDSVFTDAAGLGSDAYNSASGALSDAYNGSGLQSAFNSGKDALKSIGFGSNDALTNSGALTSAGGGASSYGGAAGDSLSSGTGTASGLLNKVPSNISNLSDITTDGFGQSVPRGTAASLLGTTPSNISNLSDITVSGGGSGLGSTAANIGGKVATSSSNYFSPLASLGIGSVANSDATNALLKQANANKALLSPFQNFSFSPGDLTQDPGYQFNLQQGNQALDRKQLASGGYFSGNALKEAQQFGQGLADNTYNSAFNRALQTNNAGLNAALQTANINDQIGNTKATSDVNEGNLFSGALGNALGGSSFTNSGALQGGTDIQALLKKLLA